MAPKIPLYLLKTKSAAGDHYEEKFSVPDDNGFEYEPEFVPVLEHEFNEQGMAKVRGILKNRQIGRDESKQYGGMIFTSQRAAEAFTKLVEEGRGEQLVGEDDWPFLQDIPVYSVGPATTRALKAVPQVPSLQVFGSHTGNGEILAPYILDHYRAWYKDRESVPPLLFLVGDKRRDIIPKVLTGAGWQVDEVVIYGTGEMKSFRDDFAQRLETTSDRPRRWVVVFSPSGCDSMLSALDLLDEGGKAKPKESNRSTYIATIGPTTRDHLIHNFGYDPEVSAEHPSPEGVWNAITGYRTTE
ncbi:tetrapyrrole biosynthesis, uroporphyrinogen III synthase [Triangularia verruculosa]|uniref:Tetrapyrrole biosynthesis, uroporphyrinogen III synthase n=1 Tax=Triangularia verruculosa TaxID=2587418 RepID=A0AAN6X541_9PEZI|nr:tetrapyrrole biosynthesis, uroporphyrinogen III synthase [Triangularia verruculosa]